MSESAEPFSYLVTFGICVEAADVADAESRVTDAIPGAANVSGEEPAARHAAVFLVNADVLCSYEETQLAPEQTGLFADVAGFQWANASRILPFGPYSSCPNCDGPDGYANGHAVGCPEVVAG